MEVSMPQEQEMTKQKSAVRLAHPSGFMRLLFRFPILLYRLKLGWLLGGRMLLLEHRGRKSGITRRAVIEVVDHDEQKDSYTVAAAWGKQADWYKNIEADPKVNVEVGRKRFAALAETLSADDAAQHLSVYANKHPFAFRQLGSKLFDIESRDTAQVIQSMTEAVPFVEFTPAGEKAG
jgi:deazaflavin-dependent oxidoreductase (nitroreductase family)